VVKHVCHRRRMQRLGEREAPELLARLCVGRSECVAVIAEEDHAAHRDKDTGPRIAVTLLQKFPNNLTRLYVERAKEFLCLLIRCAPSATTSISAPNCPLEECSTRVDVAAFQDVHVEKPRRGIVRRREE